MGVRLAAVLMILVAAIAAAPVALAAPQAVTVGLYFGDNAPKSVTLGGAGDWKARKDHGHYTGVYRVRVSGGEIEIVKPGDGSGKIGRWVDLTPAAKNSGLALDGRTYRGLIKIEAQPDGGLKVTNKLEMEDYLQGVIPNEMFSIPGALDALKVQAVISRTLAMFIKTTQPRHEGQGFDVCATGHCQFYRGLTSETNTGNEAVKRTRGEILTYQGKAILAAYHANAGGYTAPTDEAWPGSLRVRYLTPVRSPYDDFASQLNYSDCFQWRETIRPEQIRERVRSLTGKDPGEVRDIIVARSDSDRVKELRVIGSLREVGVTGPQRIRTALGLVGEATGKSYDHDLRLVTIERNGDRFSITGYGAGEGVGLSQHGAIGMARAGFTYPEILGHYYRGVSLSENYGAGDSTYLRAPDLRVRAQSPKAKPTEPG